tara:strand:- start:580 stop:1722 length:1143 start_codon:yes stop_codon:yes gene_type:complete
VASLIEKKNSKGEKRYQVFIRLKGYPPQVATFKRKTDALRWATQTEAAILEGRHFKSSEAKKRTFAETAERYLRDVAPARYADPIARKAIQRHLGWWKAKLGHYVLADVTPDRIAALRDKLLVSPALDSLGRPLKQRQAKSAATVTRYLASLSVMFTTVVNEWGWLDQNPVKKVHRPRESDGRVRFLSDSERAALLEACQRSPNHYLYTVVAIALSTGARYGEIMNLRWRDIDLDRGIARLEKTKNRERRALPLVHVALDCVRALHKQSSAEPSAFLFARSDGQAPMDIRKHWYAAVTDAGIEDFRFHDLRHSAASYLAMNGATLAEIAEVLGHKTLQMVKRYAHLSDQHTAAVVERMNRKIFAANDNNPLPKKKRAKSR